MGIARDRELVVLTGKGLFLIIILSVILECQYITVSPTFHHLIQFFTNSFSADFKGQGLLKKRQCFSRTSDNSVSMLTCMSGCMAASFNSGTMSKPNLLENLIHRITRRGSSLNVSLGDSGVRITPFRRSSSPCHAKLVSAS